MAKTNAPAAKTALTTSSKPKQEVAVKRDILAPTFDLPDYLQSERTDAGAEQFAGYIVPPRIKVVQKQADDELLAVFNPGDVILVQQGVEPVLIAAVRMNENGKPGDEGEPWHLIPVFFYTEWCTWNPIELKGTAPAILERTQDPNDPLVAKCRNPKLRQEKVGEADGKAQYKRHVEHLNFVVMIAGDHPLAGQEAVLGFQRGEHRAGSSFMALHNKRKAPLFSCVYEAQVNKRPGQLGQWHGIDLMNPSEESGVAPFVTPEQFALTKQLHEKLKEAHAKNLIMVDYDTENAIDEGPGNSKEF